MNCKENVCFACFSYWYTAEISLPEAHSAPSMYSGYSSASPCYQPQPIHIVLFPKHCRCIVQWWRIGTKVRGGLCLGVKCQMFATVPWVVRHLKASLDAKCWMFDALVGKEQAHTSGWRSLTVQAKPAAHPPAEARQCIYSKHRIPPSVLLQRDCKQLWIWIMPMHCIAIMQPPPVNAVTMLLQATWMGGFIF